MLSRRDALKTLALSTGALVFPFSDSHAQAPAEPQGEVHKLPPLGYDYDALEPLIDAETLKLHHDKHHAAYVAKLNQALEKEPGFASKPLEELLRNLDAVPESIRADVRNQGGGHYNHTLLWQTLRKQENAAPSGELAKALEKAFGSVAKFQEQLTGAALKVFGSGWAWLVWEQGKLAVQTTENQDSPLSRGAYPLLGIDVWEHAYYLKYENRRAEYLEAIKQLTHWDFVAERLQRAQA